MKEITEIVRAFDQAKDQGQPCALLTLVHVEGSSYRRPGARMLVTDDGRMTGAISGGCLEGDALTKALFVLHRSQSMIVTYDTLDDDDAQMGVGLGCNGVIQVLIEPIDAADPINPIELLRQAATCRQETVLVTLFSLADRQGVQPGTCLLQMEDNTVTRLSPARQPALYARLFMDAEQALANGTSAFKNYVGEDLDMTAFIECLKPPLSLVILGAGNDVIPLVRMADILGWKTTVIDGRPRLAKQYRFLPSCHVFVADQQHALRHIPEDSRTAVLLMTHNYHYDQVVLRELLERDVAYIGCLGPRKKLARMLADLKAGGVSVNDRVLQAIHGPAGLDIGAETPEEIALSILAEIKAFMAARRGQPLRTLESAIHSETDTRIERIVLPDTRTQNLALE